MHEVDNFDVLATLSDGRSGYFDGHYLWTSTGTTIHRRSDAEAKAAAFRAEHPDVTFAVVAACYADPWERICAADGSAPVDDPVE